MLKNYLKIAFRNLLKDRVYSLINIAGLAVGLASFVLIALFVHHELSYDRYHTNADRIYRLAKEFEDSDYPGIAKVTAPWGEAALQQIPEVEKMSRFIPFGSTLVRNGEQRHFENHGFFTDASVFQIFSFRMLLGDPETALVRPNTVVITRALAEKYFESENALGKTLLFGDSQQYTVTGVMQEVPENSHFTFDFLVSLESYSHPRMDDWLAWQQFYTYLLLDEGVGPKQVENKMRQILKSNLEEDVAMNNEPFLQPLPEIHLYSNLWREIEPNSDIATIYLFGAIGLFILLVAGINFVNLMTARAGTRSREVGVRKAIGAAHSSLIRQFLGESIMISAIAMLLAMLLVELALPGFSSLTGSALSLDYVGEPVIFLVLMGITLVVGLAAGIYPAMVLSSPEPSSILGGGRKVRGSSGLRRGLVVFQFVISASLIISTLMINRQLQFIQNKKLGFNQEQLVVLPIRDDQIRERSATVKSRLLQHAAISEVTFTGNLPGGSDWGMPYSAEGVPEDEEPGMRTLAVDYDFIETFGMNIVGGRDFNQGFGMDAGGAFIINEEAAKQLNWQEPLGKTMSFDIPELNMYNKPVVGVVEDFHFRSMKEKIAPIMLFVAPQDWLSTVTVRVEPAQANEALAHMESVWSDYDPLYPFTYSFFDESFGQLHESEKRLSNLIVSFTLLAIIIACLGLFGLAAFSVERRSKEIGIRKVLGATVPGIMGMLSKEFLQLVAGGFVLALPLSYLLIRQWLSQFAYKTEIGIGVFVLGAAITLSVALAAVIYQSVKAALMNPVKSLRKE